MRVQEVAALLGVSKQTILRLEREGKIKPAPRDMNDHRRYIEADVEAIRKVIFGVDAAGPKAPPGARASARSDRVSHVIDRLRAGKERKHGQGKPSP